MMENFEEIFGNVRLGDPLAYNALNRGLTRGQLSKDEFDTVLKYFDDLLRQFDSVQTQGLTESELIRHKKNYGMILLQKAICLQCGCPSADVPPNHKEAATCYRLAIDKDKRGEAMFFLGMMIVCDNTEATHEEQRASLKQPTPLGPNDRWNKYMHNPKDEQVAYFMRLAICHKSTATHSAHYCLANLILSGVTPTDEDIGAVGNDKPHQIAAYHFRECIRHQNKNSAGRSYLSLAKLILDNQSGVNPTSEEFAAANTDDRNEVAAYFCRLAIQQGEASSKKDALTTLVSLIINDRGRTKINIHFLVDMLLSDSSETEKKFMRKQALRCTDKIQKYLLLLTNPDMLLKAVETNSNGEPANLLSQVLHNPGRRLRMFPPVDYIGPILRLKDRLLRAGETPSYDELYGEPDHGGSPPTYGGLYGEQPLPAGSPPAYGGPSAP